MYEPEADEAANEAESTQTGADHPGDNDNPPSGSDNPYEGWVPRDRFNAALAKERNAVSQLKADLASLKKTVEEKTAPKKFTKAELDEAVENGKMSRDKADDYYETQLKSEIVTETAGAVAQATREQRQVETINSYEAAVPALQDEASDAYQHVIRQYAHLTNTLGLPANNATMIAALEATCGPLNALGKGKAGSKKADFEPLSEVGSGGGAPADARGKPKGKTWNELSAGQRKFCDEAIVRGAYTSREAYLADVNYVAPRGHNEWSLSKARQTRASA